MKRVLTVGLQYTGEDIDGVEFDNLGFCRPAISPESAAFALYEYDTIIINPKSFSHFLFGQEGEFSDNPNELGDLKRKNNNLDIDTVFDRSDREKELAAAIERGTTVVWCICETKRVNFFGSRENLLGYLSDTISSLVRRADMRVKKCRQLGHVIPDNPFARYFDVLTKTFWTTCLGQVAEGYHSVAETPEGYSIGGRVEIGGTYGWLVTSPTSEESTNQLIRDAVAIGKKDGKHERYHGIFLSHTGADKPFVRRLRDDLKQYGVENVWVDEAEIELGDSLIEKISTGLKQTRYVGVVLSSKSIEAPWVKKELEIAMNREIINDEVVVLPLLYEGCELPVFLQGKLYADFTTEEGYQSSLDKIIRRLRIG